MTPQKQTFKVTAERLAEFLEKLKVEIQDELKAQGHVLTGTLLNSIEVEIQERPNLIRGLIWMEDYGEAIDTGVPASSVPFSGATGRGGTSDYIQGLFTFFKLKGLEEEEALSAAFATAYVAKREGHPTRGSFVHSTNGRRTGFFTDTLNNAAQEIDTFFDSLGGGVFLSVFNSIIDRFEQKIEPVIIRA